MTPSHPLDPTLPEAARSAPLDLIRLTELSLAMALLLGSISPALGSHPLRVLLWLQGLVVALAWLRSSSALRKQKALALFVWCGLGWGLGMVLLSAWLG